MSLQGGFMSFQETTPSAMRFRDQTVASVSVSITGFLRPLHRKHLRPPASLFPPSAPTRRFLTAAKGVHGCEMYAMVLWWKQEQGIVWGCLPRLKA